MDKQRWGGGSLLLLAGGFFGRETGAYLWEGILNIASAGMGERVTWGTFPWANAAGVVSFFAGVVVLLWPQLKAFWRRPNLDDDRVKLIVDEALAAQRVLDDGSDTQGQVTALANAIEGISTRLDTQQSSIARIRSTANFVEAIERAKIAAKLLPGIERARELHNAKRDSSIGTGGRKGPHAEVTRLLPYLGAKASGLENAIKRRTEAITADGVTHTILPEEAGIWADGAKKRAWLIEDAKMEEMIAMLKRVIGDASTPEVFLMNQRIEMDQ